MRWKFNALAMVGLRLDGACAAHFWVGWLAWCVAGLSALYAEFHLRVHDPPVGYLFEAGMGLLLPFAALQYADHVSLMAYQRVWFDLTRPGLAPAMLEINVADRIRAELAGNLLLRWFRPPKTTSLPAQMMTIALWYTAVALHPSRGFFARYGEWVVDVLGGYCLLAGVGCCMLFWAAGAGAALPWLPHVLELAASIALAILGYSAIRFGSRRQAVLDYFRDWRIESLEHPTTRNVL